MAILGMGSFPLQKPLCHPQAPADKLLGNVGCLQRGSNLNCRDCPLPPKAGEHHFLPHPTSPLARSLVPLPMLPHALHPATCRVSTRETHGGASQEVPRAGPSPGTGTGFGAVRCCMAAGILGSRAEHLGPMDTRWPRESGSGPKGLQGVKLSNVLAQRLRSMRLGRPGHSRPPVQSPLLK